MNMLSFQRISRRCFGHTIFLGLKHVRRINFLHGQWGGYTLKWWVSQLMSIGIMMLGRVMEKTRHHQPVRLYSLFIPNQVQHKVALRHHVRTKCLKQSIGFQSSVSVSAGQGESSDSLAESSPVEIRKFSKSTISWWVWGSSMFQPCNYTTHIIHIWSPRPLTAQQPAPDPMGFYWILAPKCGDARAGNFSTKLGMNPSSKSLWLGTWNGDWRIRQSCITMALPYLWSFPRNRFDVNCKG